MNGNERSGHGKACACDCHGPSSPVSARETVLPLHGHVAEHRFERQISKPEGVIKLAYIKQDKGLVLFVLNKMTRQNKSASEIMSYNPSHWDSLINRNWRGQMRDLHKALSRLLLQQERNRAQKPLLAPQGSLERVRMGWWGEKGNQPRWHVQTLLPHML